MAVGIAASAITIVACSDSSRPAPSGASGGVYGSTSGGASSGGSSSTSSGSSGADGSTEGGVACDGPTQLGEAVVETRLVGDPPPALGGVAPDGTYILTARNSYGATVNTDEDGGAPDGGGGSTDVKRATMVIAGASIRFSSSKGPPGALPADTATTFSFATSGTSLDLIPVCPAGGTPVTIPFSSVGTGIALFVDPTHREVYVRQ